MDSDKVPQLCIAFEPQSDSSSPIELIGFLFIFFTQPIRPKAQQDCPRQMPSIKRSMYAPKP
ncbi:hypothetical protein HYC85_024553 [Camellia sinensis]|uniref:Uncharacterized protein n=1 Tax=Camellia sinensis TaxID=4442 RepID=A0A7J7G918_CAMSI|nr:hypothetical protein HYC85_024553 [Camellia sinensis]